MSRYKYFKLNYVQNMIQIVTIDNRTLDWIIGKIEKMVPTCKVYRGGDFTRIEELQGNEKRLGAWIIQVLCKQGWEPYAGTGPIDGTVWHHLRYSYATHELSPIN